MSNRKGTYFEIDELTKRVDKLEKILEEFMEKWGPDVQRRRDERDAVWDEMVKVVSRQNKHKQPKPGYDIHGNKCSTDKSKEENH